MALIKQTQDDVTYAIATGRIYSVRYRDSVGKNNKPMATFSVGYDYTLDDEGKAVNLYISCVVWGNLAEYIGELADRQDKPNLIACGKLKTSEYNDTIREQIEVDYVSLQPTTTEVGEKKPKQKKVVEPEDEDLPF